MSVHAAIANAQNIWQVTEHTWWGSGGRSAFSGLRTGLLPSLKASYVQDLTVSDKGRDYSIKHGPMIAFALAVVALLVPGEVIVNGEVGSLRK